MGKLAVKRSVLQGQGLLSRLSRRVGRPAPSTTAPKPKLLDQVRQALPARHYSRRTEDFYVMWIKRLIFFHHVRHPAEMGEPEINRFLTDLAAHKKVSASTQNQALSALLFLYCHVLGREVGELGYEVRARRPTRLPIVLTREEVKAVPNSRAEPWRSRCEKLMRYVVSEGACVLDENHLT